jgi:hypothetical protein
MVDLLSFDYQMPNSWVCRQAEESTETPCTPWRNRRNKQNQPLIPLVGTTRCSPVFVLLICENTLLQTEGALFLGEHGAEGAHLPLGALDVGGDSCWSHSAANVSRTGQWAAAQQTQ